MKALPGVGTLAGGVAQTGLAGATTYAIGHLFCAHFEQQGTLATLDPEEAKPLFSALLERGKEVVDSFQCERARSVEETIALLERLERLRAGGAISETEFARLKADVLSGPGAT